MAKAVSAVTNKVSIRANCSLMDIEEASIQAAAIPKDYPVVLELARNVGSALLIETAIASLIATVAARPGRLIIKDMHHTWNEPSAIQRFVKQIDGVAALFYCSEIQAARLQNVQDEDVPREFLAQLQSRLLRTAIIEDANTGQSRTFLAADPQHGVTRELAILDGDVYAFRTEIDTVIRQFGVRPRLKERGREDAEDVLYRAVFELFQNTVEHGRKRRPDGAALPGLRYVRFQKLIGNSAEELAARANSFEQLKEFLIRRTRRAGIVRFLEITVSDSGSGILSHFRRRASDHSAIPSDNNDALNAILTGKLTSKRMPGTGLGLPIALSALRTLKAFVSLRSEESWLFRDFDADTSDADDAEGLKLLTVPTPKPVANIVGTHFTMLIDFDI
jgi:signal transduction histidine kinase